MRCPVCGTENEKGAVVCEECGAKISPEETEIVSKEKDETRKTGKEEIKKTKTKKDSKSGYGKKQQKAGDKKKEDGSKKFNTVKVTYTIVFLLIIGGLLLYSSGVFDQPEITTNNSQQQIDEFHRGADLSQLREINRLREAVTNNPNDHESKLHLAHLLNDSGFKEEAIKWYNEYIDAHPEEADVWVDMGVCYFDMNEFANAIMAMKKGIELNPKHQIAHFNLGIVNYTKGDIKTAKEWWNKAIEINPSSDIAARAKELIQNN